MTGRVCRVTNLGRMAHAEAEVLQERLVAQVRAGEAPDALLLVEHEPVVTVGRAVKQPKAEVAAALLESAGAEVRQVSRGGRATFHGPGQIVGYPILNLRRHRMDLHWYLRALEQVIIEALGEFSLPAERVESFTGVWIAGRKIASIGVAVRGWVTWHGFSLNLDVDAAWWRMIDPCGLRPEQMASLSELSLQCPPREELEDALVRRFGDLFGLEMRRAGVTELFSESDF